MNICEKRNLLDLATIIKHWFVMVQFRLMIFQMKSYKQQLQITKNGMRKRSLYRIK